jgi:hypothetical protein
MISNL